MKILVHPELEVELSKQAYLLLDTNIFIGAISNIELLNFILHLKNSVRCSLLTIPPVAFEFTRGSDSLDIYNKKAKFLDDIVDTIYPIHKHNYPEFNVLMQKLKGKADYTDFLLCVCLYHFRTSKIYLMTSDHSAMPLEIFDRKYLVTTDNNKEIQNIGVYQLNLNKFSKVVDRALK